MCEYFSQAVAMMQKRYVREATFKPGELVRLTQNAGVLAAGSEFIVADIGFFNSEPYIAIDIGGDCFTCIPCRLVEKAKFSVKFTSECFAKKLELAMGRSDEICVREEEIRKYSSANEVCINDRLMYNGVAFGVVMNVDADGWCKVKLLDTVPATLLSGECNETGKAIQKYLDNRCVCTLEQLMAAGCVCGQAEREKAGGNN
jgi:hypothetical protein